METQSEIMLAETEGSDNAVFEQTIIEMEELLGNEAELREFLEAMATPKNPRNKLDLNSNEVMHTPFSSDFPVIDICSSDDEAEIDCFSKKTSYSVNDIHSNVSSSSDCTSCFSALSNVFSDSDSVVEISSSFNDTQNPCNDSVITSDVRPDSPSVAEPNFSLQDLLSLGVKNVSASFLPNNPELFSSTPSAPEADTIVASGFSEHLLKDEQKLIEDSTLSVLCDNVSDSKTDEKTLTSLVDSDKDGLKSEGKKSPLCDENFNVVYLMDSDSTDVNSPSPKTEELLLGDAPSPRTEELLLADSCDIKTIPSVVSVLESICKPGTSVEGITPLRELVVGEVNEGHLECLEAVTACEDKEITPFQAGFNPVRESDAVTKVNEDRPECFKAVTLCADKEIIPFQAVLQHVKEPDAVTEVSIDHPESLEGIVICDNNKNSFPAVLNPVKELDVVPNISENHPECFKGVSTCEDNEIFTFRAVFTPVKRLDAVSKVTKGKPDCLERNLVTDALSLKKKTNSPAYALISDVPLPSPPIISDLEFVDGEPLFPSFRDVSRLPSSFDDNSVEIEAWSASSELAPLPLADLLTELDSPNFGGSSYIQPPQLHSEAAATLSSVSEASATLSVSEASATLSSVSEASATLSSVSEVKGLGSFRADSLLFGQEAESELCKLPGIGISENGSTSASEGKTPGDVPSWQKPWVSTDDAENADNNDPEWDIFRKLQTDEERYRVVREKWRQLEIPDPRRDLTRHNFRRPTCQSVCKTTGNSEPASYDGRQSRKRSRSDSTTEENPSKRRRMLSCTKMYDHKIQNLHQQFDQEVLLLRDDHQRALKDLSVYQQEETDRMLASVPPHVVNRQMDALYRCQLKQVENLKAEFDSRLHRLSRSKQDIICLLDRASREVLTFNKFYNDLGGTDEDHCNITQEEFQQFEETEEMYDLYDQIYTG